MKIRLRPISQGIRLAFGRNGFTNPSNNFGRCYLSTSHKFSEHFKEEHDGTSKIRSVLVANRGNPNMFS